MRNKKNIRTCLGCYTKKEKQELFRIANVKIKNNSLSEENEIIFDERQNCGGRGAYICSLDCLEKTIQNNWLQRRIKSKINKSKIDEIKNAINERITVGK